MEFSGDTDQRDRIGDNIRGVRGFETKFLLSVYYFPHFGNKRMGTERLLYELWAFIEDTMVYDDVVCVPGPPGFLRTLFSSNRQ